MFGLGRLLVGFVQVCSAVFGVGCCGEGGGGRHGGCTGQIPAPLFRHTRACRGYLDVRGAQAPRSLRGRVRGCSGLVGCVRFCSGWVSGHSLSGRGDFGCSEAVRICSGLFGCVRGGLLRRGRRRRAWVGLVFCWGGVTVSRCGVRWGVAVVWGLGAVRGVGFGPQIKFGATVLGGGNDGKGGCAGMTEVGAGSGQAGVGRRRATRSSRSCWWRLRAIWRTLRGPWKRCWADWFHSAGASMARTLVIWLRSSSNWRTCS